MEQRLFEENENEEAFVGGCCVIHTRDETVVKEGKKETDSGNKR